MRISVAYTELVSIGDTFSVLVEFISTTDSLFLQAFVRSKQSMEEKVYSCIGLFQN